jgi:hypothetical protein
MRHKLAKQNVVEVIAEGVRSGLTLEAAAALAGVHRSTLHRWRTAPPGGPDGEKLRELQEAVAQAQAANLSALVNVAQSMALSGDGNMIRFLLERRHGWRPEAAVELRGDRALGVKTEAEAAAEPTRYIVTIPIVDRIGGAVGHYSGDELGDGLAER